MAVNPISILGILLIVFGCYAIFAKRIDTKTLVFIISAGIILIVLTDPRIVSIKCGSTGCGVERTGLPDANSALKYEIARNNENIEIQSKNLETKLHEINTAINKVNSEASNAPIQLPSPKLPVPLPPSHANGDIVSVFFRNGKENEAKSIVSTLKSEGYIATAANSSLQEIAQWAPSTDPGSILIAVQGSNESLAQKLKGTVEQATKGASISLGSGWTFQESAAQIYLF